MQRKKGEEGFFVPLYKNNAKNQKSSRKIFDFGKIFFRATRMVVACFANNPAGTYDVILMDVLMPKMNGHQAARAIRAMSKERPDAAKIPIIAQSANAFKEDVQASLDSGMNGHISKPFNIDAVTTAIKQNIKR